MESLNSEVHSRKKPRASEEFSIEIQIELDNSRFFPKETALNSICEIKVILREMIPLGVKNPPLRNKMHLLSLELLRNKRSLHTPKRMKYSQGWDPSSAHSCLNSTRLSQGEDP